MEKQLKKASINGLILYLIIWISLFAFIMYLFLKADNSLTDSIKGFTSLIKLKRTLIGLHIVFVTLYLLLLMFRYFIRIYKKRGFNIFIRLFCLRLILPITVLLIFYKSILYSNNTEHFKYQWNHLIENTTNHSNGFYSTDRKHRGVHVFGWRNKREQTLNDLLKSNMEWIAVVPFIYQENEQTKVMITPKTIGKWTRRDSTFINSINDIHSKGMHVMLKPHLWLGDGWQSNITMDSEEAWANWFKSYRKNMLHYATLAKLTHVELLCIGTELRTSIKQQPEAWIDLIKEVKTIYQGKLTYAANWDDENNLGPFWEALDYIGIQAYFPLTKNENPNLETIKSGWNTHIKTLESLSKKFKKPILFTEVGYKSEASATIKPWEWDTLSSRLFKKKSDRTQQLAYQALFESLWHKEWFAGLYIWQWHSFSKKENAIDNLDFSPRFKPAENTISKWFSRPVNK